jgi:hypothetical protein
MMDINHLRLLDNVSIPEGLDVRVTAETSEFMHLQAQLNSETPLLFGTAYRQGNRLHFGTAMSVRQFLNVAEINQARKGSTLAEVRERTNRPKEAAHAKAIGVYLGETACVGLPFIFPSFLLNYGLDWDDSQSKGVLTIFAGQRDALAWPAIFSPPVGRKMKVTDGGHRTDELDAKMRNGAGRLGENALSVLFIMEDNIINYHQDFADCAKAKAISHSLKNSWDVRDNDIRFGVSVVERNQYLRQYIDATSNSVNLSSNAAKAWSMSALQSALTGVHLGEADAVRVSDYFDTLFEKVPLLKSLVDGEAPAQYRNNRTRGGCVLFRGVGLAVLMQAYKVAVARETDLHLMAEAMGKVDWFVLKPDAPLQDGLDAHTYTRQWAQPIWLNMLAMMAGDQNFRIKGTKDAAQTSYERIATELNLPHMLQPNP